MITADFHNHTCFSSDSTTMVEHSVQKAISLGFDMLCITDHMDRCFPPSPAGTFEFDPEPYFDTLQQLKYQYRDQIELLFGVEFGLRNEPDLKEEIRSFYDQLESTYPFDYIIGSTHILSRQDPYFPDYWQNRRLEECLGDYFKSVSDNASWYSCFDVYGHLDYIVRYTPEAVKDYRYEDYRDVIDDALRALIRAGKGIELNTAGYKTLSYPHPKKEILRRYIELGGEIITIGSDAHTPEFLGYEFGKAAEYLKECGFRYYTVFRGRKPVFRPL